ncbi:hypothetical protein TERMP_00919 [Thermococcus barophilus MP]|uniref:Uncharacterized protein n=1 Tax=Thermococcus barophilus (strain DSM 11836 / MP) TaxID=391623 RepID=F0LM48_THEBM|nr:hypothetical protein TERMP_00919 [Thermococcus barophilus MP]
MMSALDPDEKMMSGFLADSSFYRTKIYIHVRSNYEMVIA